MILYLRESKKNWGLSHHSPSPIMVYLTGLGRVDIGYLTTKLGRGRYNWKDQKNFAIYSLFMFYAVKVIYVTKPADKNLELKFKIFQKKT